MKKSISILLCCCLIFTSAANVFATPVSWDSSDSTNLATIKNAVVSGGVLYNVVNACSSTLNNINYNLVTLMGWLDPSTGGSTTALLNQILNALVYTNVGGATVSFLNDLRTEALVQSNMATNINSYVSSINAALRTDSMNNMSFTIGPNGTYTGDPVQTYNFVTSVIHGFNTIRIQMAQTYGQTFSYLASNYNTTQSLVSFANPNSTVSFLPYSVADGIFKYLNAINTPVARLGYVLASDEEIEAKEAAAANQEAVVDNFIDSQGSGSASVSDYAAIAGMSSGLQSNVSTDASPSGIWDIFNSSHGTWFSQETYNQLDTTVQTRGPSFETPLLDQQIEDIYRIIGGDQER